MKLTQPISRIPIASVMVAGREYECRTHPEFVRFFEGLFDRVGGTNGAGTGDLEVAQFEDAGIAEQQKTIYELADVVGQLSVMQAEIDALRERVQQLENGVMM